MNFKPVTLAVFAMPLCSVLALAQGDPVAMARSASANQLGVLEYCQAQGDVDPAAITAQKANMARLPAAQGAAPTDDAESLGKQGTVSVNGTTMTLAGMASSHNTTVDAICKQMGSSAVQAAAAFAQQGSMPSMPSMSGGMPKMPNMPSMGSMPGMPGAPSH